MEDLPHDLIHYLFIFLSLNKGWFSLCIVSKRYYEILKKERILKFKQKYSDPKSVAHIRYMDEFIRNKKSITIVKTQTSYDRRIVYFYCFLQNIPFKKIQNGFKKRFSCPYCFSVSFQEIHDWNESMMTFYCFDCKKRCHIRNPYKELKHSLPHYAIQISKRCL